MDAISLIFTNISSTRDSRRHSPRSRICQPKVSITQQPANESVTEVGKICMDLLNEHVALEKCFVSRSSSVVVTFKWGRHDNATFTLRYSFFHKGSFASG